MANFKVQVVLEDNVIVCRNMQAENELQAMDKVYEHYKNNNIKVYDIKILCINKNNMEE